MPYKPCRGSGIMLDKYLERERETWFASQKALDNGDILLYSKLMYSNIYADAKAWNKNIHEIFKDRVLNGLMSIKILKSSPKIYLKLQRLINHYELSNEHFSTT